MDSLARNIGFRNLKKADWDWLYFENQSGEWSVRSCEAFEKHLKRLEAGWRPPKELLWYGERGLPYAR